jgi:hypothetical protein
MARAARSALHGVWCDAAWRLARYSRGQLLPAADKSIRDRECACVCARARMCVAHAGVWGGRVECAVQSRFSAGTAIRTRSKPPDPPLPPAMRTRTHHSDLLQLWYGKSHAQAEGRAAARMHMHTTTCACNIRADWQAPSGPQLSEGYSAAGWHACNPTAHGPCSLRHAADTSNRRQEATIMPTMCRKKRASILKGAQGYCDATCDNRGGGPWEGRPAVWPTSSPR